MRCWSFLIIAFLSGCHASNVASEIQTTLANPTTTTGGAIDAFCKLDGCPIREDPRGWIRIAGNRALSLPARELAFHAFFRRFAKPPIDFGAMVTLYGMQDVLSNGILTNAGESEAFPNEFANDVRIGKDGTGLYLWDPWTPEQVGGKTGEEDVLGIWFVTSRIVTVEDLRRAPLDQSLKPIVIIKVRTLGCSQARLAIDFYHGVSDGPGHGKAAE